MATTNKSTETSSKTTAKDTSDQGQDATTEEVLRPFQEASEKFLQANVSAHQDAAKQYAQTYLDSQQEISEAQQEAYESILKITRKYLETAGQQQKADSPEEAYLAQAQSQFEYEKAVRQIYIDTDAKLQAIAQKLSGDQNEGLTRKLSGQRQDAYQTYLSDLQKAWSGAKNLSPEAINAIASNILSTISAASQAG
jgi:protoporphyrinogen oxidase